MSIRNLLFSLVLCCSALSGRGQQRDSVWLYNGQELIGEIQSASLGSLSIDDIDLRVQNIKLYKIRRLESRQLYKIETFDKHIYYGIIGTVERDGWVVVKTGFASPFALPISSIHQLILLNRQFLKSLDGNLSLGFSYAKSSGIGQVTFSGTVGFATKRWQYQLQGSEIGSIDSSTFSRDNENLQLFAGYDLSSVWFAAATVQYQRNLELSVARRFLQLLGAGNKLVIKDTWQLMAISGISFNQELSTDDVSSGVLFEIPLMFRFNFYQFHHPNIQITSSQTAYFSLSEKGRIRLDGNTSFSWELVRDFYLSINPYTSFDSKPPTGGGPTFDFGVAISLSYKF
ncbi:MAG TPA: DUF481 domain-containing protein [Puia sp.]|jgi:hypothetical protein